MKISPFLSLALSLSFVTSCRTVPIETRAPIQIPQNLSLKDVEISILTSLTEQASAPGYNVSTQIVDNAFKAALGHRYRSATPAQIRWFPESSRPGTIFAGHRDRHHYLRAKIEYAPSTVNVSIDDSTNLRQSETSIHKVAISWLNHLEIEIRQALMQASLWKLKQRNDAADKKP